MKKLTQEQVNKKYKGKYIEVIRTYDYEKQQNLYEVVKTSKVIKENMTLGEDLGTSLKYRR
jgi:hypothetical protein